MNNNNMLSSNIQRNYNNGIHTTQNMNPNYPPQNKMPYPNPNINPNINHSNPLQKSNTNLNANPNYFTDRKKGEVNELKNLLREMVTTEKDIKKRREIIKKVIAYMTLGIDVSRLFSEMVLCVETKDLILKKMVYLYLTNYASKKQELAIMCINTLLNDCKNEDPMVRGLALRSLCSLRLNSILEYIYEPLHTSLTDPSAYVRKTGVMGILKVFSLNPKIIKDTDLVDTLYNMIKDRDPQVAVNCIMVLNEVMAEEGGMAINQPIIFHLLNRILEFNEWGQSVVLNLISKYNPTNTYPNDKSKVEEEVYCIFNVLESVLRVSSSSVVLATTNVFLKLAKILDQQNGNQGSNMTNQVIERLKQPLITLLAGGSYEINHCVLHHIYLIIINSNKHNKNNENMNTFNSEYRQFYARYNEPSNLKYIKIRLMAAVADNNNVNDIITELSEYVTDLNEEISKRAIRAIGAIAARSNMISHVSHICETLLEFIIDNNSNNSNHNNIIVCETIIMMKALLKKYPSFYNLLLPLLPKVINSTNNNPQAKCAIVYIIGEFGQHMRKGPYVLESIIETLNEENDTNTTTNSNSNNIILNELLTATLKLFFKKPGEMLSITGKLFYYILNSTSNNNIDVHDKAMFYYRLLKSNNIQIAKDMILSNQSQDTYQPIIDDHGNLIGGNDNLNETNNDLIMDEDIDLNDKIYEEFNTLAVIYMKPSETFIPIEKQTIMNHNEFDDEEEDEEYEEDTNEIHDTNEYINDHSNSINPTNSDNIQNNVENISIDLLDMNFSSPPKPTIHEVKNVVSYPLSNIKNLDASQFQQKWQNLSIFNVSNNEIILLNVPSNVSMIENLFIQKNIFTMASGEVENEFKYFFYASNIENKLYYLLEVILNKYTKSLNITLKSEDTNDNSNQFFKFFKECFQFL